jgi:hypothetical protein
MIVLLGSLPILVEQFELRRREVASFISKFVHLLMDKNTIILGSIMVSSCCF